MTKAFRGPYKLEITVTLTLEQAIHIGTGSALTINTDSPILRDENGHPLLPGSSIRGVLRNWCEREACILGIEREDVIRLFGPNTKEMTDTDKNGKQPHDRQGRLVCSSIRLPEAKTEIRDHICLNPEYETVAKGAKFDQEVTLIKDVAFTLTYEGDGPNDPEIELLHCVCQALEERLLSFGGKSGIGLGAIQTVALGYQEWKRQDLADLSRYLLGRLRQPTTAGASLFQWPSLSRSPRPHRSDNLHNEPVPLSWLRLTVQLQFNGPMLSGGPYRGDKINDHKARFAANDSYLTLPDGTPYLSGSALRGVLRTNASRLLTTLNQIVLLDVLFGAIKGEKGQRGLVKVGRGSLLDANIKTLYMNHVAIDRISGFAANSALFNTAALASPCFELTLRLFWRPDCQREQAAVALLLFLLRDMQASLLWLGANTTAGYGHIKNMKVIEGKLSQVTKAGSMYTRSAPVVITEGQKITEMAHFNAVDELIKAWRVCVPEVAVHA